MRDALDLLERFDVPDPVAFGARYPHQVSGGQLQRAMIAMAMISKPEFVVFDEPTTSLDVATQAEVLAVICEAVSMTGAAGIYISHDLAVVSRVADQVTVVDAGRVLSSSRIANVRPAPISTTSRHLSGDVSNAAATREGIVEATEPIISLDGIVASYGDLAILNDISLSVRPGSAVGLVGRSGSGKSSIARVVMGLLPPTIGTISFRGRRLSARWQDRPRAQRAAIQLVYQSPDTALNPSHTVQQIVARPLELARGLSPRARSERVRALLDAMGLEPAEFSDRRPGTLSGGQKQRVAIARALTSEPRLLLCDEITSALDAAAADIVLERLAALQKLHGISVLFISHELSTVRAICDDVVVLEAGRVAEVGPVETVFRSPQSPATRHLLAADARFSPFPFAQRGTVPPDMSAR